MIMKNKMIILLLLVQKSLLVLSQAISVDSILAFYKNADIDCYKERIYSGMQDFDSWLSDSLYNALPNTLGKFYSPSNIDIRKCEVIPFVSLAFFNMSEYDVRGSIYDHIIIDSTRCVVLVPIDRKGRLMGQTDNYECYSYTSFTNKEAINYRVGYKSLRYFLKKSKKYNADAIIVFTTLYPKYEYGYIKNGRIYMLSPKPKDLEDYVREDSVFLKLGIINKLDELPFPSYRASFQYKGLKNVKKTGHTHPRDVRLCP